LKKFRFVDRPDIGWLKQSIDAEAGPDAQENKPGEYLEGEERKTRHVFEESEEWSLPRRLFVLEELNKGLQADLENGLGV
jgi:hypothetical protein